MNDIASMAERYSLNHLVDIVAKSLGVYAHSVLFKHLEKILFDILKNKV